MKLFITFLFVLFSSIAFSNDITPEMQFELGLRYEQGQGVQGDFNKALELYQSAAEAGYAPAQVTLGYLYQYGEGIIKDSKKAQDWYLKAIEQGSADAQLNLAVMYDEGVDIPQDKVKANELYRHAAEQGNLTAQLNLGINYWRGDGVERDYVKAYIILNHVRAASQDKQAKWKARSALDEIKKVMSKEQLKELKIKKDSRISY